MSESTTLNLKVGDKVTATRRSSGYFDTQEGDVATVTELLGSSFKATRDRDGFKLPGCSSHSDYWTPVTVAPILTKTVGAKVTFNQNYSNARRGDTGVITSISGYTGQLAQVELDKGGSVIAYLYRFDVTGTATPVTHKIVMPALATLAPTKSTLPKRLASRAVKLATMAAAPRSYRKAIIIATLRRDGKSVRQIAKSLRLSKSAVGRVVQKLAA